MSYILCTDDMESPDEPPKSQYKPPPVIPREENRMGTNKKTYFVTNERELISHNTFYKQNEMRVNRWFCVAMENDV